MYICNATLGDFMLLLSYHQRFMWRFIWSWLSNMKHRSVFCESWASCYNTTTDQPSNSHGEAVLLNALPSITRWCRLACHNESAQSAAYEVDEQRWLTTNDKIINGYYINKTEQPVCPQKLSLYSIRR